MGVPQGRRRAARSTTRWISSCKGAGALRRAARRDAGRAARRGDFLQLRAEDLRRRALRGDPSGFIQDEVRAELFNYFRTCTSRAATTSRPSTPRSSVEIAGGVRDSLLQLRAAERGSRFARNARARQGVGVARRRAGEPGARASSSQALPADFFRTVVETADDVADELEEAAFNLTLLSPAAGTRRWAIRRCARWASCGARDAGVREGHRERAARAPRRRARGRAGLPRGDPPHPVRSSTTRDEAQRSIKRELLGGAGDAARALHALAESRANLEQAADALMHCGLHAARPRARRRPHGMSDRA